MKTILSLLLTLLLTQLYGQDMNARLIANIENLEKQVEQIDPLRKERINELSESIKDLINNEGKADVLFVCTHNSRRSQLAELWLHQLLQYYEIGNIRTFSGGTEATAFNPRMVNALERYGFSFSSQRQGNNPKYIVDKGGKFEKTMFSKKFDDPYNPSSGFIAVMVCSDADQNCPFVPGAFDRIPLTYLDPKAADDSPHEKTAYDEKVIEIGREMIYLCELLED